MTVVTDNTLTIRMLPHGPWPLLKTINLLSECCFMGHGHCYRHYIDYQSASSWAMVIVDNTLPKRMLLHEPWPLL